MQKGYTYLEKLIAPVVNGLGYEFIGSERFTAGKRSILRIYIDSENGVDLDACVKVSEQVDAVLEVEANIKGSYSLEVSSPGLDRKIFTVGQLAKEMGNKVKLRLYAPDAGKRKFIGTLKDVNEENCTLILDNGLEKLFILDDIDEVRLVPDF